jgi:selenium metabolism protein YedF
MDNRIDVRGLPCPQPVLKTRDALQESDALTVIVDNEVTQGNVTRMVEGSGGTVSAEKREDGIHLTVTREGTPKEERVAASSSPVAGPLVLVVSSEFIGRGEHDELGRILARGFFHTLGEVEPRPEKVIFFNSGVKLVVEGSPVLDDLQALHDQGVEMLVCGTCLEYYELAEKIAVGEVSNMYTVAETMLRAGKVVNL